ncbi:YHS domain-containing protein [Roseibium sp. TrichSKD4]|nr:YHS domain-containing protein [Roseibium sp. TrichSKD4]
MWPSVVIAALGLLFLDNEANTRPKRFISDPITGLALAGHDPVAYFVDGYPRRGSDEYTYQWGGALWVFVNQGNREAFKLAPHAYAPLYAGCGGYALSEGYATAGNPTTFAFINGRLVFFHSPVNRFLYLVNVDLMATAAAENARKTRCEPLL